MKLRTGLGLLVVSLGVGASATAAAQAPPAPGAPPPAAAAPRSDAPASSTAAVGFDASGPDSIDETDEALPARVPWRGTNFTWTNTATTSVLNVGQEQISGSHESYDMSYAFKLNYYVVDQDKWSVQVHVTPSFGVELTNSDVTTTRNEPYFNDLPVGATYGRNLFSHEDGWSTSANLGTVFFFPSSPLSQGDGTILRTSQRVGLSQAFPLAGKDSPVFKTFSLAAGFRWDHRFTEATTGVSDELQRERMAADGSTVIDDQLSGAAQRHDTIRETLTLSFDNTIPPGMPITLSGGIYAAHSFAYSPSDTGGCDVIIMGDQCVEAESPAGEPNDAFNTVGFTLGLDFQPLPEMSVAFGYDSGTPQLGPDGQRRSLFFNPNATFSGALTLYPDALYERMTGPRRKIAKNDKDTRRTF
jgi:hypothetical protein